MYLVHKWHVFSAYTPYHLFIEEMLTVQKIVNQLRNTEARRPIFLWFALASNQILMYLCLAPPYSLTYMAIKFHLFMQQHYIWIPHIIEKLHRVVNPLSEIPSSLHYNALQDVIWGIQQLSGDNVYSGVFLLGKVHILVHIFCHVSYKLLVNN